MLPAVCESTCSVAGGEDIKDTLMMPAFGNQTIVSEVKSDLTNEDISPQKKIDQDHSEMEASLTVLKLKEFASVGRLEEGDSGKKCFRRSMKAKRIKKKSHAILCKANIFGCEVIYKHSYNSIAIKLDSLFPVISKIIPTSHNISNVKYSDDFVNSDACKGGFASLNYLKIRINKHLYNQALKDMLNNYEPFERSEVVENQSVGSLQRDHVKIFGMDVAFIVARNKVFFDILGSFTILGELGLPMRNKWDNVDAILLENGITHRDAFRRYHKWTWTQRSHISLQALLILTEHGLVQNKSRQETLLNLFRHIDREIALIGQRKQQLFDELQRLAENCEGGPVGSSRTEIKQEPEILLETHENDVCHAGTEKCNDFCGRQYHFTYRCCSENHAVELADKSIGYIVNKGRIFLEKCTAFSALGRMYVIRCSDYRKADKILNTSGMKVKEHYLYERRTFNVPKPRKRRTHLSLEAFIILVHKGFAYIAKKQQLLQVLQIIIEQIPSLKRACPNFEQSSGSVSTMPKSIETTQPILEESKISATTEKSEEDSSVKVEVESKSIDSCQSVNLLGKNVLCWNQNNTFFLYLNEILEFLPEEERQIQELEEKMGGLRLTNHMQSFVRKGTSELFISVECLLALMSGNLISPVQKEALMSELRTLSNGIERTNAASTKRKRKAKTKKKVSQDKIRNIASPYNGDAAVSCKEPSVCILDTLVPCQVVNDILYLEEKSICQICCPNSGPLFKTYRKIDRVIEQGNICLDDAFLYDGRKRGHISTIALKILIKNNVIGEEKNRDILLKRLEEIETEKESLKINRILDMGCFGNLAFKSCRNTVFIHTMEMLKIVGFGPSYLNDRSLKIYPIICKLLRLRGLDQESCFLKQGKSRYVYVSLDAVLSLLQTKFGPFKDKEKMWVIRSNLLEALKKQGFTKEGSRRKTGAIGSSMDKASFKVGSGFPSIPYKAQNLELFVHRKTCFEAIGLEKVVMAGLRGLMPVNDILQRRGLDLSQCYIAGERERFSYISLAALLTLLESHDPLVNCLERKEKFLESLMISIQSGVGRAIQLEGGTNLLSLDGPRDCSIPFKLHGNRLFLSRHNAYAVSGMYDKTDLVQRNYDIYEEPTAPLVDRGINAAACFLEDYGDPYGYISVDALLILMNLDGDVSRAADYNKLLWKNLLSAILMEAPKLKVHIKMIDFRNSLLKTLMKKFIFFLEHGSELKESNATTLQKTLDVVSKTESREVSSIPKKKQRCSSSISEFIEDAGATTAGLSCEALTEKIIPEKANEIHSLHWEHRNHKNESSSISNVDLELQNDDYKMSEEDFSAIKENISVSHENNFMGDWQVHSCNESEIRLGIEPGLGSSRKLSFLNPDVGAVLRYELLLRPNSAAQLFLNDLCVPARLIADNLKKSMNKGILYLLFNLLSLRPCFGSFSSELVETVQKGKHESLSVWQDVYIDKKFIGSGQNGRTYAGTVRSRKCKVLAQTHVGDTCSECEELKCLVINRSVLTSHEGSEGSETKDSTAASKNSSHQKSVWQISEESSAEGCIFVCPQLQSFNTSLPHNFSGNQQASSIVEHKVEISSDLKARIFLNQNVIQKSFANFERDKLVGPLLEWVASLRVCVGYPDIHLVECAKYLLEKKHVLQPEINKFFNHVLVDENFNGKMISGVAFKGTVRTVTCRFVAGDHADICDQCLLLQEPIEFLSLKEDRKRK